MVSRLLLLSLLSVVFTGCASGAFKARQEQREKMAASSGMYCEFISGDLFPDTDVELSLSMAKRCDSAKNFSITNYKNSSDQYGMMYCCAAKGARSTATARKATPAPAPAPKAESSTEFEAEITPE